MARLSNGGSARVVGSGDFATTHWSVVLAARDAASPQAQAALEQVCRSYWRPLYFFARRSGHPPEEAEDLTQEFFARLLGKQLLCGVMPKRCKFRSFLLTTFKCFLINVWNREHAQKRGGRKVVVPIDEAAESRYRELLVEATPDTLYERECAWTVLNRVEALLRQEWAAAGKAESFEWLRSYLPGAERPIPYAKISDALRMNEPAVRMAVHRLRRRYGELLRAEIASTVSSPAQIDEEIRCLAASL